MDGLRFHIVDVFAVERYAGNQLAVVEGADAIDAEKMQAIAREFGFSETTFIESVDDAERIYGVRIFTPEAEIPFAGHPTLGTAFVIREAIAAGTPSSITLDLPVGPIPVRVDDTGNGTYWMRQQEPTFGPTFDRDVVAEVIGIDAAAIEPDSPVQAVSTGLPTVIVPVRTREALERVSIHPPAYDDFVADHDAKNVLVFCPDPRREEHDLAVRVFAPFYGVPEDPATGSANGCLAGYLLRHGDEDRVVVTVEQGYELNRPSLLRLRAEDREEGIDVRVGGAVVPVAEGTLVQDR